jgi:hypothetical protein
MNMRLAKLLDAKTYSTDQTEVININLVQPISAILIEVKSLNSTATPTAHGCKSVPKVEIIDGSRVIHSLSGMQIQSRAFYNDKRSPENVNNYINDSYNTTPLYIPFGRFLGDKNYALDPLKFSQLQLRITVDIGAGAGAADAVILDVDAFVFDGKAISPKGFLMAREHYNYALVSSAIEVVDLPVDKTLRNVFIASPFLNKAPNEQYNHIKLTENNDQKVPFDFATSHYLKLLGQLYGKCKEHLLGLVDTSGVAFPVLPAYEAVGPVAGQGATALYFSATATNGGVLTIKGNAAGLAQGIVEGLAPHGAIVLPFGVQDDDTDWYEMNGITSLKLKITGGSSVGSSSVCSVVTEQVELY